MSIIRVGCCGYPGNREHYQEELSLVEVQETFRQLPRPATAERWRESAPRTFAFSLRASQIITHPPDAPSYRGVPTPDLDGGPCGHFQWTPPVQREWTQTAAIARLLQAVAVVFETPTDFTPTRQNRLRLAAFFEQIDRPGGVHLVWDAQGLWDAQTAAPIARDLGLALCADGHAMGLQDGGWVYVKLRHASYTDDDLERIANDLDGIEEGCVLFQTNDAFARARRLQSLLEEV